MNTKKATIVWVFGGSGAGKETFIRYVVKSKPQDLLLRLGWEGRDIIACEESMEWVSQGENDPRGPKREDLLHVIPKYATEKQNEIFLVKGQDVDLKYDRPQRLKSILPDFEHKILYIHTDSEEQLNRWKKSKQWYKETYTVETAKNWLLTQLGMLAKLKDDFEIVAIHGGEGRDYEAVSLPNELSHQD